MSLPGLSFVICCHNSAERLPTTLYHIMNQAIPQGLIWEVIVVDNASTDKTREVATSIKLQAKLDDIRFKVIEEPQLGISYARYRGIAESRYEFICFIDDDNWVDETYAEVAYRCMSSRPTVAACGSLNEAVTEGDLPCWFEQNQRSYAVGPQSEEEGDVTKVRGVLWSAGMVLRKSSVEELLNAGFQPLVSGARGEKSLMRSEDYELCLALKLRGWSIWYEPRLRLKHFLPKPRLDWHYLRKLLRGVGESDPGLLPYYYVQQNNYELSHMKWLKIVLRTTYALIPNLHILLFSKIRSFEGRQDILLVERSLGLIKSLLHQRGGFDRQVRRLLTAEWINSAHD